MAVDESLDALSVTASNNTPLGTDAVGVDLDNHLRDLKKNLRIAAEHAQGILNPTGFEGQLHADKSRSASGIVTLRLYHDEWSDLFEFDTADAKIDVINMAALEITAGTTASLGIRIAGDRNTGLMSPGADQLALFTGGSQRVYVDSAGKVGIGIAAPDGTLHVHAGNAGTITANSVADDLVVEFNGAGGISILTPDGNLSRLVFAGPSSAAQIGAEINYSHNTAVLILATNQSTGELSLQTAGGVEALRIDSDGAITAAKQPAFLAHNSVTDTDVTGAGATTTVDFDTEIFDQGADFATDTFTAPVAGRYLLTTGIRVAGMTGVEDSIILFIATSNRNYENQHDNANEIGERIAQNLTVVADMDANDTATVTIRVLGESTDVVDVEGSSTLMTFFSGCLLA